MSKYARLIVVLLFVSLLSKAQTSGSTIRIKNFIKTWGFLKYHHPLVASGNLDWDSIFVSNVEGIINARNSQEYNARILEIINSAGTPYPSTQRHDVDSLFLKNKPSVNWITAGSAFSKEVKKKLRFIYDNNNQDTNKYIKIEHNTANFSGENKFEGMQFPDTKHRLLFLSRFWNIINYFAPYKYLTTDWDEVLDTLFQKLSLQEIRLIIIRLYKSLASR